MSIDVQAAQASVGLRAGHSGRLKFKVQNMSDDALVVVGTVNPAGPTPPAWVTDDRLLVDRPQRTLAAQAMDEFVVEVSPPLGSPSGHYPFALRVAPVDTAAVQLWGESSQVTVVVEDNHAPAPPAWPKWLAVAIAVLLGLGVGGAAFRLFDGRESWTSVSVTPATVLGPSDQLELGIGDRQGSIQAIRFDEPQLVVSEGPFVVLDEAADDDVAQNCADALKDASPSKVEQPPPIDGRPLCFFIGEGRVAVAEVLELRPGEVVVSVDSWRLA